MMRLSFENRQDSGALLGTSFLDSLGVATSAICIIHCALIPILCLLPAVGYFSHDDLTHKILAFWVSLFCLTAIGLGYSQHKSVSVIALMVLGLSLVLFATFGHSLGLSEGHEVVLISIGNLIVIRAHFLNRQRLSCGNACKK